MSVCPLANACENRVRSPPTRPPAVIADAPLHARTMILRAVGLGCNGDVRNRQLEVWVVCGVCGVSVQRLLVQLVGLSRLSGDAMYMP